jgi:hypothetical protein
MKTRFEVWDVETGNAIDAFPDEDAALAFVRAAIEEFGDDSARTLALIADSGVSGKVTTVAVDTELAERARAAAVAA